MKKLLLIAWTILLIGLICGCSNSSEESKQADKAVGEMVDKSNTAQDIGEKSENADEDAAQNSNERTEAEGNEQRISETSNQSDRMVIYTANLSIEVKSYQKTMEFIQQKLESANGYVVESNSYTTGERQLLEGTITVRLPQEQFKSFLQAVENGSTKVNDRSISGQDVTEEYVDLEARLKSKQIVEARLLDFMSKAEKTEDLLKISNDLAAVQEEIEQIKGRMNYLNNKVDLATVTIHLMEDKVNVPGLENKELNTWERTQEQFMNSINFLLQACSALIIFFVGSLPILAILGGLLLIIILIIRKRRKLNEGKPPGQSND
ncbi:hypothetical protein WQ54_01840 [Bacillus sp. SA1-12]|uniref:DUF4349 domain-containing protein n=1 Tax=Bacillus sp. SA1-12 TaxID=1455638 RepID=UPI0006261E46|nr:DUF4349 domain-containing protein [Bacillus sp. SA1-12]KKI93818.1 hypothetical protein WQ54_01840 [Bacillus sp. SA1-12]